MSPNPDAAALARAGEVDIVAAAEAVNGNAEPRIEVLELWRLPLNFFELSLEDQWKAMAEITVPGKKLTEHKKPCKMSWWEQAHFIAMSLLVLGLPLAILPVTAGLYAARPSWLKYWFAGLAVLALHPITPYKLSHRRRRFGVILARWFTFTMVIDRNEPLTRHYGTPKVDEEATRAELPIAALACPHGVLNFGAICWVFFSRWVCGYDQYTAGAPLIMHVPGIRYLGAAVWFIHVDRQSLVRHFRERPTPEKPRGGIIGIVPDGIAGIFHSTPGRDVLHLGSKRGLMRIACEEGALLAAGWFPGTTDVFTVVQDPFGVLRWVSRKLRVSLFLFYGLWGLPIPRRVPTSMCPAPVRAPRIAKPTDEDLEKLHQQVYGGLAKRFEVLKHYAGFPERTLQVT